MLAVAYKNIIRTFTSTLMSIAGVAFSIVLILIISGFATGFFRQAAVYAENSGADLFVLQDGVAGTLGTPSIIPRKLPFIQSWIRQFGDKKMDSVHTMAVGPSGIFLAGNRGGKNFIRRYSGAGEATWNCLFGSPGKETIRAMAVGQSGLYVAGVTRDQKSPDYAGSGDVFLKKI